MRWRSRDRSPPKAEVQASPVLIGRHSTVLQSVPQEYSSPHQKHGQLFLGGARQYIRHRASQSPIVTCRVPQLVTVRGSAPPVFHIDFQSRSLSCTYITSLVAACSSVHTSCHSLASTPLCPEIEPISPRDLASARHMMPSPASLVEPRTMKRE